MAQDAIDQCRPGDRILIAPGIYNESAHIKTDISIALDGNVDSEEGEALSAVIISRYKSAILIDHCTVKLHEITMVVEEGTLQHHPLEIDNSTVEMTDCEMYGGMSAMFCYSNSNITAKQCKFHNAFSSGANTMNSKASFEDCYFFKNREDGLNICGPQSNVSCSRCYIAENAGFGVQVYNGASATLHATDIVKNQQVRMVERT